MFLPLTASEHEHEHDNVLKVMRSLLRPVQWDRQISLSPPCILCHSQHLNVNNAGSNLQSHQGNEQKLHDVLYISLCQKEERMADTAAVVSHRYTLASYMSVPNLELLLLCFHCLQFTVLPLSQIRFSFIGWSVTQLKEKLDNFQYVAFNYFISLSPVKTKTSADCAKNAELSPQIIKYYFVFSSIQQEKVKISTKVTI